MARANLRRTKDTKVASRRMVEDHLTNNNSCQMWQGLKQLTNYNSSVAVSVNACLAEKLNNFHAWRQPLLKWPQAPIIHEPSHYIGTSSEIHLHVHECEKATGMDRIPASLLKDCALELSGVFTKIFNLSLAQVSSPPCLRSTTLISDPESSTVNCLNEYRPIE